MEENFDSVIIARKLARFCPTSLSVDDLQQPDETFKRNKKPIMQHSFIPPTPHISVEKSEKTESKAENNNSRFASIFKQTPKTPQQTTPAKLIYELPNVTKVQGQLKTGRPLIVVSLSSNNLASLAKTPVKETKQVESVSSSNSESEYMSENE